MDWLPAIFVLLLVLLLMMAWAIGKVYAIHADISPLVNSPLARTLSGVGT